MTTEVTVNSEGTLDEMVVTMEMDEFVYNMMLQEAREDGYDSVEEYFKSEAGADDEPAWRRGSYEEEHLDDEVIITLTVEDGDPEQIDDFEVFVEDDEITFVETNGFEDFSEDEVDEYMGLITVEFTANMPGDIIETNGVVQDDEQSVVWNLAAHHDLDRFEVTSERPDDDPIPGFGIAIAIAALIGLGVILYRISRNGSKA